MCLKVYPCTHKIYSKKLKQIFFITNIIVIIIIIIVIIITIMNSCSRFLKWLPVPHPKQSCSVSLHYYMYFNTPEHHSSFSSYLNPYFDYKSITDLIQVFCASNNTRHVIHVPAKGSQPGESDHFRVPMVEGCMKSL